MFFLLTSAMTRSRLWMSMSLNSKETFFPTYRVRPVTLCVVTTAGSVVNPAVRLETATSSVRVPFASRCQTSPSATRSARSVSTPSAATTTRIFCPSPGTGKVLIILIGVSSAEVSRLRSSRFGSFTPVRVSTAPRSSGRDTWNSAARLSLIWIRPPRDDSTKPRSSISAVPWRPSGAAAAAVTTRLPSISTSPSWRSLLPCEVAAGAAEATAAEAGAGAATVQRRPLRA